ncbi:MAG: preprotein translocase subunit SecY [Leptotrichiaceae bacterium]|nr:preprotein translocase subunit SecY [Leptotrichiaceae bacterium]
MTLSEAIGTRLKALTTSPELKKRVMFTLGMFIVARIGIHIAVPGINMELFKQFQSNNAIAGFLNLFSGGAVERASILSLGITPYINASIVFQLLGIIFPKIEEMQREGGKERDKITQWTRYVTITLALIQSFGLAIALMNQGLVIEPGARFVISTMALVTGGTAFLMWLSERISIKGIGNGTSMLIFLGIVSNLPSVIRQLFANSKEITQHILVVISILLFITIISLMVIIQLAERRIPIQYAGKGSLGFGGGQSSVGRRTYLPLKINTAGVMPIIFASVLMAAPGFLIGLMKSGRLKNILTAQFQATGTLYLLLFALLIILFSFFYTLTIAFDPEKVSEDLKQSGGTIPTIRAGAETSDYLEKVVTRITFGSAVFLAILGISPNIWFGYVLRGPVLLGGTSLLILVGVAVELLQQIDSYLAVKKMKGFIRK